MPKMWISQSGKPNPLPWYPPPKPPPFIQTYFQESVGPTLTYTLENLIAQKVKASPSSHGVPLPLPSPQESPSSTGNLNVHPPPTVPSAPSIKASSQESADSTSTQKKP